MGKFIRLITRYKYNHISLSLTPDLQKLYSFARYSLESPFVGGFVEETISRYFNAKTPVVVKICEIEIDSSKYAELCNHLEEMNNDSSQYIYNTISAVTSILNRRVVISNAYTCIEFISTLLFKINVINDNKIYRISRLDKILSNYEIYNGDIKNYIDVEENKSDIFYIKKSWFVVLKETFGHIKELFYRWI